MRYDVVIRLVQWCPQLILVMDICLSIEPEVLRAKCDE